MSYGSHPLLRRMLTENPAKNRESDTDEKRTERPRVQRWIILDRNDIGDDIPLVLEDLDRVSFSR